LVVTLVIVFIIIVAAIFTVSIFLYRRKYSKNPKAVDRMCRWRKRHCPCLSFGGSSRSSHSSARYGKTNFNGFDRGAFEGAIIISSPMSVVGPGIPEEEEVENVEDHEFSGAHHNLNRHSRFSVYRGSAYQIGNKNSSNIVAQSTSDFMSNLAPQWPEPEEPVSSSLANIHHTAGPLAEREPFLAPKRHKRTSPGKKHFICKADLWSEYLYLKGHLINHLHFTLTDVSCMSQPFGYPNPSYTALPQSKNRHSLSLSSPEPAQTEQCYI